MIPLLDELTPAAREIQAVNCIIKKKKNGGDDKNSSIFIGDNTDWKGTVCVYI